MRRTIGTFIFAIIFAAVSQAAPPAVADDYERGLSAYSRAEFAEAFRAWQDLAATGDRKAQFGIGLMYALGHGVEQDYAAAAAWYHLSAIQGHAGAQLFVGHAYHHGHGVARDPEKAHEWYLAAADQGQDKAQNNLGMMYETGLGVEVDLDIALYWFEEAARNGNRNAPAIRARVIRALKDGE